MDESRFKEMMGKLRVPEPDAAAIGRALHRAEMALASGPELAEPGVRHGWKLWVCGFAVAAAALVFAVWMQPGEHPSKANLAAERDFLGQIEALFPGQLNAVVRQGGKTELELAEGAQPVSHQPLFVRFTKDGYSVNVLSYSGRELCVQLGGKKVCLEALVTEDGRIILSGDSFVWTTGHPAPLQGYSVEAAPLGES